MVARVTAGKPLPEEVLDQILEKTDGVPLFVEELTKTVLESDLLSDVDDHFELAGPLPPLAIPATLHDSLMARLDRLPEVREIAQIGAVIGRDFPHALLAAVAGRREPSLGAALDQLVTAELLFRRGTPPEATYSFKHALVRDAAYESLLKGDRRRLHAAVAERMMAHCGEGHADPQTVALHLERSGQGFEAAEWWHRAASSAWAIGAARESIAHQQHALDLLAGGAKSTEVIELEIQCLIAMMMGMMVAHGPQTARPRIAELLHRAKVACREIDRQDQLPIALYAHYIATFNTARIARSLEIARTLQDTVSPNARSADAILANRAMGSSLFAAGQLEEAAAYLQHACSRDRDELMLGRHYYRHAYAVALQYKCWLEIVQGCIAVSKSTATMSENLLCVTAEMPAETWIHRGNLSIYYYLLRSRDGIRRHAAARRKEFSGLDSPSFSGDAELLDAWARVLDGEPVTIRRSYEEWLKTYQIKPGEGIEAPVLVVAIAEMMVASDLPDQARAALEDALRAIEQTGEGWFEAEVWRQRGLVELAMGSESSAEPTDCFRRALAIAGKQGAHLFELRAARDLARLWAEQGERQKALDLLAPVYGWFTDGFDTADLEDAKALLDQLG